MDLYIFGAIKGHIQVEVGDVIASKSCIRGLEGTIEQELDGFQGAGVGTRVAWVANAVACYGDSCAIRIVLLGTDLADYIAVAYFFEPVRWNVRGVDDVECVGAINRFSGRIGACEALAETS